MPNPLTITILVDTASANSNVVKFNKGLSDIEATAKKATAGASGAINSLERSTARVAVNIRNQFSALGGVLQATLGVGLVQGAKNAVGIASSFQLAEVGIKAFVKEGENAGKVFNDLKRFSLESPLDFSTILKAANQLLALDTAATDLIPTLSSLSGAIFAVTAGEDVPERLNDVIRAIGQIKAAGALTGEEFRQLRNANIVTLQELAQAFNVTTEQFRKAIVERTVPAAEVIPAILDKVRARFGKFNNDIRSSASVAFSNFRDALAQAADDAIRDSLPKLVNAVNGLSETIRDFSKLVKDNREGILAFGDVLLRAGSVIAGFKIGAGVINAIRQFVGALSAGAIALNPWLAIPATLLALLPEIVETVKKLRKELSPEGDEFLNQVFRGISPEMNRDIQSQLENRNRVYRQLIFEQLTGDRDMLAERKRIYKLDDTGKQKEEELRRIENAEKRAADILEQARRSEFTGLADIIAEYKVYRAELGLSVKANRDLAEAARIRLAAEGGRELRKNAEERVKALRDEYENFQEFEVDKFRSRQEFEQETLNLGMETSRLLLDIEERGAEARRDANLRQLELLDDQTVAQRIAIEARRAEIEESALRRSLMRKAHNLDLELEYEIEIMEAIGRARGISEDEISARREALQRLSLARVKQIAEETEDAISAARDTAAIRSARAVQQNNIRVFEGLKRNVEGLFDAVVTRSKSFGQALGDAIKLPILAAIKEIVSSRIAGFLFELFGGGKVSAAPGGQPQFSGGGIGVSGRGNVLGRLLGIGGAGALGIGGGGGGVSTVIPGAPGGTPGFAGPVALGGGGQTSGLGSISGSLSGAAGSLKGILSSLGNIGRGGAVLGPGSNGGALAQPGVGGAAGGALLAGGATLAFLGLQRGGLSGLAMTTAGGALIGAKFGGPIGAVIGAGVGALAGTIRLFIKGAEEKIVQKVKGVYGVDISRKFARDPLLGIIKQTFGGNIDVGVRSPQIRDLIELYAMSTGQNSQGINTTRPIASSFALSGGTLTQQPVFQNGLSMGLGQASNAAPAPTVIQLDPTATEAFLQGQAIQAMGANPRAVQGAVLGASKQNAGRRQGLALAVNPGLMVS